MTRIVVVLETALALLIFAASPGLAQEAPAEAPLFEGLGDHRHEVTTDSELAQRYFDQGLILAFGFNHAEAKRSFLQAAELDPECAMCWWGASWVLGPVDQDLMRAPELATLQHYWITPLYGLVRFGRWDEVLAWPEPADDLVYPRAVRHYARGWRSPARATGPPPGRSSKRSPACGTIRTSNG